ncbi:MAG: Holliday junction resolvase RuvX [Terriglobia bacterium]
MQGRILAIDFGMKRFGLAVSDPLGLTAQGLPSLERREAEGGLSAVLKLVSQRGIEEIVIGNPVGKDGSGTVMSRRVAKLAERLRRCSGCEVKLWDERLTSVEANRMLRSSGIGLEKRRRAVDRVAAVLLLQNYLDWRSYERGLQVR